MIIAKLKKIVKEHERPMIRWSKIALQIMVTIHLINNLVIIGLLYDNDSSNILFGLIYLTITNVIVYKCLERLRVI